MSAPDYGEISEDADLLRTIANTGPFNLTGHPALSVPVATERGTVIRSAVSS